MLENVIFPLPNTFFLQSSSEIDADIYKLKYLHQTSPPSDLTPTLPIW